jgi:hypothetical protein
MRRACAYRSGGAHHSRLLTACCIEASLRGAPLAYRSPLG